jgi:4-diphosphocytidyl-2-C-methyl-D-erythritol kinase
VIELRLEALARAKINLFLHAGTKRPDGYHALVSWVAFAAIGDRIAADIAPTEIALQADGPFAADVPLGADNLVMRAAYAVRAQRPDAIPHGARLKLSKQLPVASGIGGGSADAAATLHLLNDLWATKISGRELMEIGGSLGSDVPVCVYNRSALMSGRGETIAPGPDLPAIPVVLVNPGLPVATADVFARLSARTGIGPVYLPDEILNAGHLAAALAKTANDLEAPALQIAPQIGDVLKSLRAQQGAMFARMSGSGATCFGLFQDDHAAQNAAIALKRGKPHWWVAATRLDC